MIVNKRSKLVALPKCKCICKIKGKPAKILKCIKTLLVVKAEKVYNFSLSTTAWSSIYSKTVKILVKVWNLYSINRK